MPPITRREQLELDELLGDIYKGIETLPDKSRGAGGGGSGNFTGASYDIVRQDTRNNNINSSSSSYNNDNNNRSRVIGQAHIREYELPESSPLVQRHKQELARSGARATDPLRSNNKYNGGGGGGVTGGRQAVDSSYTRDEPHRTQSLATFLNANPVGSATPESKRRVRIVDPAASSIDHQLSYVDDDYASNDYQNDSALLNYNTNYNINNYNNNNGDNTAGSSNKKHRATPTNSKKKERVKYVNTNKFIYHQERNPDDEPLENLSDLDDNENISRARAAAGDDDDDDDIDGVTRVEYYHTSWLDRQLGRASKRRSSKELNERQVKEKAMIEELKRSLKNGAITLRQSFKGKKNRSPKSNDIFNVDSSELHNNNNNNNNNYSKSTSRHHSKQQQQQQQRQNYPTTILKDHSPSRVITSGLATLPKRDQHKQSSNKHNSKQVRASEQQPKQVKSSNTSSYNPQMTTTTTTTKHSEPYSQFDTVYRPAEFDPYSSYPETVQPKYINNSNNSDQVTQTSGSYTRPSEPMQSQYNSSNNNYQATQQYSSRTLPHKKSEQHQLLQSHYRGTLRDKPSAHFNTSPRPSPLPVTNSRATPTQQQQQPRASQQVSAQQQFEPTNNKMRITGYNNSNNTNNTNLNNGACSPSALGHGGAKSPIQQQLHAATTISGIPSATEVVRSALSRSGSQISLNQLNKTINLLPNSPPATTPTTPTQQLKPATPTLSPSPTPGGGGGLRSPSSNYPQQQQQYSSKTLGSHHHHQQQQQQQQQQQYLPGQTVLHGTRTLGRPPQATASPKPQQQQQQQQQQQPVYANPHAAFMQHRMEQQMKQPNRNVASIREFNELDSLLRSLSPGATGGSSIQTHITPGYSSKPNQPTFGGYMQSNQPQQQQQQQAPNQNTQSDIYARVQRPQQQQQQQQQQPQQRPVGAGFAPAAPSAQPSGYTIDVTNKKYDENCRRGEALNEFETPIELVPSMEDYQNIAKLNPVKNHFWYKPNMSRDLAISLLKDKPQGTFIVRDSTSFRGAFGLAVKVARLPQNILASLRNNNDPSAEYIRHFLIEPTGSGVRLKGYANEPVFDSLADLIYQHSLTELALPCKLIIPRADIEDPRFNQKQKQFFDDFIASKEQAKHQPYERTSPDGGYRRYPGDVYVHNEHRIIFE